MSLFTAPAMSCLAAQPCLWLLFIPHSPFTRDRPSSSETAWEKGSSGVGSMEGVNVEQLPGLLKDQLLWKSEARNKDLWAWHCSGHEKCNRISVITSICNALHLFPVCFVCCVVACSLKTYQSSCKQSYITWTYLQDISDFPELSEEWWCQSLLRHITRPLWLTFGLRKTLFAFALCLLAYQFLILYSSFLTPCLLLFSWKSSQKGVYAVTSTPVIVGLTAGITHRAAPATMATALLLNLFCHSA